jgi:hypothetical protein
MSREFEVGQREQREWEAQERAVSEERSGAPSTGDRNVDAYRIVARALRTPPLAPLPSDFAARTAARARALRAANEQVEVWLERGLLALLLLAGAAALFIYNGDWLRELDLSVSEGAAASIRTVAAWGIAVAACVGLSSALARKP